MYSKVSVLCTYLFGEGLFGSDEDAARVGRGREHPEDGKLGTNGLPAAGRSSHKHIVISVIESIEHCTHTHRESNSLQGQ